MKAKAFLKALNEEYNNECINSLYQEDNIKNNIKINIVDFIKKLNKYFYFNKYEIFLLAFILGLLIGQNT